MRNEKKKKNKEEIKSGDQGQNQTNISTPITGNQDKTEAKDLEILSENSDTHKEFCEKYRRGLINNISILLKHGMILDESHITDAKQLASDSKNPSQYKPLLQTLKDFQKQKANQDQPVSKFKPFK